MNHGKIRFAVSVDWDGDCTFDVEASTLDLKAHAYFWGYEDYVKAFGQELVDFPFGISRAPMFEVGEDSQGGSVYMLLKAVYYDGQGHSALQVIVANNKAAPEGIRVEFSIPAEVGSLNRLGAMLTTWDVTKDSEIIWEAQTS